VDQVLAGSAGGAPDLFITLKKDRTTKTGDFERELTPPCSRLPMRVSLSVRPAIRALLRAPIEVMLSSSDPGTAGQPPPELVEQMKGLPEVVAPRINGDLRRPEVVITPRLDLAASLGVNTSTLSQAIRIATIGEIDQNAAKFSLSDRQVPIRVRMPESAARSGQHHQHACAHASGDRCP
jgi:multidrug efflux pump subunit AcrB